MLSLLSQTSYFTKKEVQCKSIIFQGLRKKERESEENGKKKEKGQTNEAVRQVEKWKDKKTGRQADRHNDKQTDRQTERSFVGLSILLDSKSGVDPPLVLAPGRP